MVIKHIHYQTRDSKDSYYYDRPHGTDEYVLVLSHTHAWFHSGKKKYLLGGHQMFIYDKNTPQLFYSANEDFVHDWFHFDMTDAERAAFDKLDIPFGVPITLANSAIFSDYIKLISMVYEQETDDTKNGSSEIVSGLLDCFFKSLSYELKNQSVNDTYYSDPHYLTLCEIRNKISSFPYQDWSLNDIAKTCKLSKTWFQHLYKKYFGSSLQKDLPIFRINYAKECLIHSNEKIEYIAYLCGYNSSVHFVRQFKSITGLTPSEFRNEYVILKKDSQPGDQGR